VTEKNTTMRTREKTYLNSHTRKLLT